MAATARKSKALWFDQPAGQWRIVSDQFGYPMYAADFPPGELPWSDQVEDAYVYDGRDNQAFKLRYWKGMAKLYGLNPDCVRVEMLS